MKALFHSANVILFVLIGMSPAVAQPHRMTVATDTHSYVLVEDTGAWHLNCVQQEDMAWEHGFLLEGAMTDLSLQAKGAWLILAGVAREGARLAGEAMEPGPFLALINRKDGKLVGSATLAGPADTLSVTIANEVLACTLVSGDQVVRRYVTFESLHTESELRFNTMDFIVNNGTTSSDPSGNGDTTGSTTTPPTTPTTGGGGS